MDCAEQFMFIVSLKFSVAQTKKHEVSSTPLLLSDQTSRPSENPVTLLSKSIQGRCAFNPLQYCISSSVSQLWQSLPHWPPPFHLFPSSILNTAARMILWKPALHYVTTLKTLKTLLWLPISVIVKAKVLTFWGLHDLPNCLPYGSLPFPGLCTCCALSLESSFPRIFKVFQISAHTISSEKPSLT